LHVGTVVEVLRDRGLLEAKLRVMSSDKSSPIKLTPFDGTNEKWVFWKTKTIGVFMMHDTIYDLISQPSARKQTSPKPQVKTKAKAAISVKVEDLIAEGTNEEKIAALSAALINAQQDVGLEGKGDSEQLDSPVGSSESSSRAKRIMYGAIVGSLTESAMKFLDGVELGDGLALWHKLVNTFEKGDSMNRVVLLSELFTKGYVDSTDSDFTGFLARFNALCERIRRSRNPEKPLEDDIKQALIIHHVSKRKEYETMLTYISTQELSFDETARLLKSVEDNKIVVDEHEAVAHSFFTRHKPEAKSKSKPCKICRKIHEPRQCDYVCEICEMKG